MNCPRCSAVALDERDREGIQVDVCPSCRGVWLDRGELERFVARAMQAMDREVERVRPSAPPLRTGNADPLAENDRSRRRERDDDDDDDDDRRDHDDRRGRNDGGHGPRRRGWLGVFDLFD